MKKKRNTRLLLQRLVQYASPYHARILCALLLAILNVTLSLTAPVLIGYAIDKAVSPGQVDRDGILWLLAATAGAVALSTLFGYLMNLCTNSVAYAITRDLRRDICRKLNAVEQRFIDDHPHGDLMSRMVNDVDAVGEGLQQGITQLFSGLVMIIATLGFMLRLHYVIAFVVVLITPLSVFVASFITRFSQNMFKKQSKTQGELSAYIEEYVGNQKLVKTFGHEEASQQAFEEINDRLKECGQKAQFVSSWANPSTRFVNGLVTAAVTIVGAVSAVNGTLTVGQIATFITYANQYTKPFNEVTGVIPQLQAAAAGAHRIFALLDEPELSQDPPENEEMVFHGQVDVEDVSFSYVPEKPLIRHFTLHVSPGQRVAIVGPTGCGKTTLINLLMRFYDVNSGAIRVDGVDIRELPRHQLRSQYGMVLQESWLKCATIRDNIAYGRPDASEEDIRRAAKEAHIARFIERLPEGYDTVISEDGANLSQGQRQLLCIARVMLCDPPMLILDEATSSIDTRTEIRVQRAFAKMMKGRTSFIVAHRLSTIREADVILVMKDGNIIEQGTHETLLRQQGFYYELYNSQFAES